VRHQGRFLTGDKAEKLGAAVREVCEAKVVAGDAYRVLVAMGCKMHYQVLRRGFCFRLLLAGQAVDVALVMLETQGDDGRPASFVPDLWLLEAKCLATRDTYEVAVAALCEAKEKLVGLVELAKPGAGMFPTRPQLGLAR